MEKSESRVDTPGGAHRRVLWRGRTVFVAEPGSAITALLVRFAAEHPEQVTALGEEELQELYEAPELHGAALPIAWERGIGEVRHERDLSQRELAEMAGVGVKSVIRCELGDWRPTHKTIQKVSRALGLHPDEVREVARFVREASESLVCPPELVAVPALSVLAAAVGSARVLEVKGGWREFPALWTTVVADLSSKKTPPSSTPSRPPRGGRWPTRLSTNSRWRSTSRRCSIGRL